MWASGHSSASQQPVVEVRDGTRYPHRVPVDDDGLVSVEEAMRSPPEDASPADISSLADDLLRSAGTPIHSGHETCGAGLPATIPDSAGEPPSVSVWQCPPLVIPSPEPSESRPHSPSPRKEHRGESPEPSSLFCGAAPASMIANMPSPLRRRPRVDGAWSASATTGPGHSTTVPSMPSAPLAPSAPSVIAEESMDSCAGDEDTADNSTASSPCSGEVAPTAVDPIGPSANPWALEEDGLPNVRAAMDGSTPSEDDDALSVLVEFLNSEGHSIAAQDVHGPVGHIAVHHALHEDDPPPYSEADEEAWQQEKMRRHRRRSSMSSQVPSFDWPEQVNGVPLDGADWFVGRRGDSSASISSVSHELEEASRLHDGHHSIHFESFDAKITPLGAKEPCSRPCKPTPPKRWETRFQGQKWQMPAPDVNDGSPHHSLATAPAKRRKSDNGGDHPGALTPLDKIPIRRNSADQQAMMMARPSPTVAIASSSAPAQAVEELSGDVHCCTTAPAGLYSPRIEPSSPALIEGGFEVSPVRPEPLSVPSAHVLPGSTSAQQASAGGWPGGLPFPLPEAPIAMPLPLPALLTNPSDAFTPAARTDNTAFFSCPEDPEGSSMHRRRTRVSFGSIGEPIGEGRRRPSLPIPELPHAPASWTGEQAASLVPIPEDFIGVASSTDFPSTALGAGNAVCPQACGSAPTVPALGNPTQLDEANAATAGEPGLEAEFGGVSSLEAALEEVVNSAPAGLAYLREGEPITCVQSQGRMLQPTPAERPQSQTQPESGVTDANVHGDAVSSHAANDASTAQAVECSQGRMQPPGASGWDTQGSTSSAANSACTQGNVPPAAPPEQSQGRMTACNSMLNQIPNGAGASCTVDGQGLGTSSGPLPPMGPHSLGGRIPAANTPAANAGTAAGGGCITGTFGAAHQLGFLKSQGRMQPPQQVAVAGAVMGGNLAGGVGMYGGGMCAGGMCGNGMCGGCVQTGGHTGSGMYNSGMYGAAMHAGNCAAGMCGAGFCGGGMCAGGIGGVPSMHITQSQGRMAPPPPPPQSASQMCLCSASTGLRSEYSGGQTPGVPQLPRYEGSSGHFAASAHMAPAAHTVQHLNGTAGGGEATLEFGAGPIARMQSQGRMRRPQAGAQPGQGLPQIGMQGNLSEVSQGGAVEAELQVPHVGFAAKPEAAVVAHSIAQSAASADVEAGGRSNGAASRPASAPGVEEADQQPDCISSQSVSAPAGQAGPIVEAKHDTQQTLGAGHADMGTGCDSPLSLVAGGGAPHSPAGATSHRGDATPSPPHVAEAGNQTTPDKLQLVPRRGAKRVVGEVQRPPREKGRISLVEIGINDFGTSTSSDARPSRKRIRPLDHWRNEQVVYHRLPGSALPTVEAVVVAKPPASQMKAPSKAEPAPLALPSGLEEQFSGSSERSVPSSTSMTAAIRPAAASHGAAANRSQQGQHRLATRSRSRSKALRAVSPPPAEVPPQPIPDRSVGRIMRRPAASHALVAAEHVLVDDSPPVRPAPANAKAAPKVQRRSRASPKSAPAAQGQRRGSTGSQLARNPRLQKEKRRPREEVLPVGFKTIPKAMGSQASCALRLGIDVGSWMCCDILIPPRSFNAPERLAGSKALLICMLSAEPGLLSVGLDGETFGLGAGDHLRVPPGSEYYLSNLSEESSARLKMVLVTQRS